MPMVDISQFIKDKLDELKKREGHKSYDGVIRSLLFRTGEIDGKELKETTRPNRVVVS